MNGRFGAMLLTGWSKKRLSMKGRMTTGTKLSRRISFVAASMLAVMMILLVSAGQSKAATEPFHVDFDQSDIQLGAIGDLPLEPLTPGASIDGTITDGAVTVPADKFKFPELGITDPVSVKGFMALEGPATGTFDSTTGQLDLDAQAGIYVTLDVKGLVTLLEANGVDLGTLLGGTGGTGGLGIGTIINLVPTLTCGFAPMDVHFSTEGTSLAEGQRFNNGSPDGNGAISAEWGQLGKFTGKTKILGFLDACTTIKGLLPGLLGGLTSGTTLPIDLGSLDLASLLNNLDAVNLGPSGITLTRTLDTSVPVVDPDPTPDPAALKLDVTPKKTTVRRGKGINYRVKVANTGDKPASGVNVCVVLPQKALAGKRCQAVGKLGGSSVETRRFKVKVKASAAKKSYKVRFIAQAKSLRAVGSSASIKAK